MNEVVEVIIPKPLWSLLRFCEIHCLAACCGLDAFEFSQQCAEAWLNTAEIETLSQARRQLRNIFSLIDDKNANYLSTQLNFCGDYNAWQDILNQWETLLMQSEMLIPVFLSQDLQRSVDFYQRLGFIANDSINRFTDYAILKRNYIEIHFAVEAMLEPSQSNLACYWRVEQVDALFQEFKQLELPKTGIPRMSSLEDKPWGMREFHIIDPDGNLIKIGQRI